LVVPILFCLDENVLATIAPSLQRSHATYSEEKKWRYSVSTRTGEADLKLPYTIEVVREETDDYSGWFGRVVELPGCMTQADTFDQLGEMLVDAIQAWLQTALEVGQVGH